MASHYPPQFSMLLAVLIVAVPLLLFHLWRVKKQERLHRLTQVNGLKKRLPAWKLILYSVLLTAGAFVLWGLTQPITNYLLNTVFKYLPPWYTIQDFKGYAGDKIRMTLILNLSVNGIVAPLLEEFYFRGYLLPRMKVWGNYAFAANAVLFSLYHFWQPYQYFTLIIALLPITWMASKTNDIRLPVLTHCMMNLTGALLSFGLVMK